MVRSRVYRFLGHTGNLYGKIFEEQEKSRKILEEKERVQREEQERNARLEASQHKVVRRSRIPVILELHKQLNEVRREINELRRTHPNSSKLGFLEKKFHHIDELIMRKLKEE